MSPEINSLEVLIKSFQNVCSNLEKKAEFDLKEIERECADEHNSGAKIINDFNNLISGISETYSELLNINDVLKSAANRAVEENVFCVPYELQSDTVNCIHDLYNLRLTNEETVFKKLIDEKKMRLADQIVEACKKNSKDILDAEIAVQETKDYVSLV